MAHPKKRVSPQITSHVNRDFKRLFIKQLWKVLAKEGDPWKTDPRGDAHPSKMIVFAVVLKVAFFLTYDGTEAELRSIQDLVKEVTGYSRIVTHSVVWEGMQKVPMKYLRRVLRRTIQKADKKRRTAMDSSGLSTRNSSVWYDIRIQKKNKRKDCMKLHILVDVDTGQILSARISKYYKHDSPYGQKMLAEWTDIDIATGDGAYANRKVCNSTKAHTYFRPRKDARAKSKGSSKYKIMVRSYKNDEQTFLAVYHIRSFVESVFASIKKRFGRILLSIKKRAQHKELFLKTVCYNIKEWLYNLRAHELEIDRWKKC